MERLKASIPENLRTLILSTPFDDLHISTAALAEHFSTSLQFSQLLEQLTNPNLTVCAKDAEGAATWKRDGNAAFGSQNFHQALSCYTKALRCAPVDSKEDSRKAQAVLYINRAATLHKLCLLEPAIRDCDRAIDAQPSYSKAWYRRSIVKDAMSDYAGAVTDMEEALATETTSGRRLQIKRELAQMELRKLSVHDSENINLNSITPNFTTNCTGMGCLQKHWTKEKGWSLHTTEDLPRGSLVLQEDPYAAVVLKSARDTHCHFCFETLPADPVPCSACSIPLYCSELCRNTAKGCSASHDSESSRANGKLSRMCLEPGDLSTSPSTQLLQSGNCQLQSEGNSKCPSQRLGEHISECGGASWSAVLPTEAVLGARMLFRTSRTDRQPTRKLNLIGGPDETEVDTLCHHYDNLYANDKVELHVLGIVLGHCVRQSGRIAKVAPKVIGLIAQVRVNAMALNCMVSPDTGDDMGNNNDIKTGNEMKCNLTSTSVCTVEQVRVAQGIFLVGSRLNHSCIPNIHSSFAFGRLFIRAITNIPEGSALELCYGPQVGELNQLERKQALSEEYFFSCDCSGCSKLTLPDLLLRAFQCTKPGCMGVVLGPQSLDSLSRNRDSNSRMHMAVGVHEKGELVVPGEGKESKHRREHSMVAIDVKFVDKFFSKASLVCEENIGCCLCCGTVVDVKTVTEVARNASTCLERIEAGLYKAESHERDVKGKLKGALNALTSLRATVHAYNQQLAKGEDIVAQLFCSLGQPLKAMKHCQRSIEILEHLYNKEHVVVGNEYLKLASIALMASAIECAQQSIAIVDKIFTVHYGSDYASRIPHVVHFKQLVNQSKKM